MEKTQPDTTEARGAIVRVIGGEDAAIYIKIEGRARTVGFSPDILRGLEEPDLLQFGLRERRDIAVIFEAATGIVHEAWLVDDTPREYI